MSVGAIGGPNSAGRPDPNKELADYKAKHPGVSDSEAIAALEKQHGGQGPQKPRATDKLGGLLNGSQKS